MFEYWQRIAGFIFFWRRQMDMHRGQFLLEDKRTDRQPHDGIGSLDPRSASRDIEHAFNFLIPFYDKLHIMDFVEEASKVKNVCWGDLPIETLRQKIVFVVLKATPDHTLKVKQQMVTYLYANRETQV